jgi:type III secretion protein C
MSTNMKLFARKSITLATIISLPLVSFSAATYAQPRNVQEQNLGAKAQLIQMVAREQPLAAFLTDLYGQMGVPVAISPNVSRLGYVNGSFHKTPKQIYAEISSAFGLVNYFDGSVMHIVTASEVQTRTFSPGPRIASRLVRSAEELGYINANNKLRATQSGMLVASGTKRFIEQVEELMTAEGGQAQKPNNNNDDDGKFSEELPVPGITTDGAKGMAMKVFYLRYAWAQDNPVMSGSRQTLIPGIASIVRSLVSARPSTAGFSVSSRRQTRPKLGGQGLTSTGTEQDVLGSSVSLNDRGNQSYAGGLPQVASSSQTADLGGDPGQVRIEADSRLNAIIIRDRRDRMPMYEQLIRQLDVEPQLVEIEATIIDVNTDKAQELGINWRWTDGKQDVFFGNGNATSDQGLLQRGPNITASGNGLSISTVIGSGSAFVSRINLLAQKGAARIVTRPQVMTLSNIEAVFDDSDTFYVRVAGREQVDLFDVSVGTTLRVLPHVFRDKGENRIRMMITVEDGKIRQGSVDGIPVVNRSGVTTQAIMLQGQSLLVGGLVQDSRVSRDTKIPGLGDVPGLGNLFKTSKKNDTRIERLFLISPRLASLNAPRTKPDPTSQEYLPPVIKQPKTYSPNLPQAEIAKVEPKAVIAPKTPVVANNETPVETARPTNVRKSLPQETTQGFETETVAQPKISNASKPVFTARNEINTELAKPTNLSRSPVASNLNAFQVVTGPQANVTTITKSTLATRNDPIAELATPTSARKQSAKEETHGLEVVFSTQPKTTVPNTITVKNEFSNEMAIPTSQGKSSSYKIISIPSVSPKAAVASKTEISAEIAKPTSISKPQSEAFVSKNDFINIPKNIILDQRTQLSKTSLSTSPIEIAKSTSKSKVVTIQNSSLTRIYPAAGGINQVTFSSKTIPSLEKTNPIPTPFISPSVPTKSMIKKEPGQILNRPASQMISSYENIKYKPTNETCIQGSCLQNTPPKISQAIIDSPPSVSETLKSSNRKNGIANLTPRTESIQVTTAQLVIKQLNKMNCSDSICRVKPLPVQEEDAHNFTFVRD